jgi:formylglycine-generating enzyme required for sulfatase activity
MSYPIRLTFVCIAVLAALLVNTDGRAQTVSLSPGSIFRDCPDCPEIVVIPAGTFTMGSTPEETKAANLRPDISPREWPARTVTIPNAFGIGRFEITRAQYAIFVEATGHPYAETCTTCNLATDKWEPV